jgi:hypothetical protein
MTRTSVHSLYLILAAASGIAWGAIGHVLVAGSFPEAARGGLYASPLIGVIIGITFKRAGRLQLAGKVFVSLLSLYLAVSLFGLAVGVYDAFRGLPNRILSAVIIQAILAYLWGLTFFGWVIILWPLAFLNHSLLWWAVNRHTRKAATI